ncbi:MAG: hypothetical protein M3362_07910 [Acidobacteriota bacterium]|nr:hypothetical protein [Acidobacteriota bacterium]
MRHQLNRHKAVVLLSLGLLVVALAALTGALTEARGNLQGKGGDQAAPQKKVAFRDAVVRETDNKLRIKEGFEFVRTGDNEVTVRSTTATTKGSSGFQGSANCYCTRPKPGKEHQGTDCHLYLGSGTAYCEASEGICICSLIIKD